MLLNFKRSTHFADFKSKVFAQNNMERVLMTFSRVYVRANEFRIFLSLLNLRKDEVRFELESD